MHVHKFSADGLTDLFVELGQKRDSSRTWERLRAEAELAKAFIPKPLKEDKHAAFEEDL